MDSKVIFLLAAVCAQSVVFGTYQLGSVAKPIVLESGYLADTTEVAAAKSAHLAALVKGNHHDDHSYDRGHDLRYHGPTAVPHVLKSGHIADTQEVAAAKAEHYAAVADAKVHGGYGYAGHYGYDHGSSSYDHGYPQAQRYHGALFTPVVLPSGFLADTHDVAAAKAGHYAAVAEAKARGGYRYAGDYGYDHGSSSYDHGYPQAQRYHGALFTPVVLPSGFLADTHEVAAAKARHYAAVAEAKAREGYGYAGHYGYDHGSSSHDHGYPQSQRYHGVLFTPVVLPSGFLADFHEVQAARRHHLEALHNVNY